MAGEKILTLIPAKGASTRLPAKNIRLLDGKSLLEWAVEAARRSGLDEYVMVSTEDPRVRDEALRIGVEVPFLRPQALARDPAGIVEVAIHALEELEKRGKHFETLIILPPTSPLRSADDIRGAYRLFVEKGRSFVMSVSEFSHTPYAALRQDEDGQVWPAFPDYFGRKSQEMPRAFRPNGAVHVLDGPRFRQTRSYFTPPLYGYLMPRERSVDIDTAQDLADAELLLGSSDSGETGEP